MKDLEEIIRENIDLKNSTRLFHGRGGKFSGLESVVIDHYAPHLLITLYQEQTPEFINELIQTIKSSTNVVFKNILLQKRYLNRPELIAIEGNIPNEAVAFEDDLTFQLQLGHSQNIGFFLDMALGRKWLRENSKDKKVLNLFSYTCSLSVAALAGGASEVVNIDMSKAALNVGRENHRLNNIESSRVRFFPYDIMKSWNNIKKIGPYDIVVIDPPTNQGESFKVERDYYKIVKRLDEMTTKGAVVLACLNSPYLTSKFLIDLFAQHASEFKFTEVFYSAFSSMEKNPEEGLKIVTFKKS